MKSATLSYHREFPWAPMSGWAGATTAGWVQQKMPSGQRKRPKSVSHPFPFQRKLWCRLAVHFDGVDLIFAMPAELDLFISVMSQNPLPSGWRLLKGWPKGRPNGHWLSRLPKEAKPWNFRQAICKFLRENETVREFRQFYVAQPVKFSFEGIHNTWHEAQLEWRQQSGHSVPRFLRIF
ncbi:hypothetical protein KX729_04375 [Rhizobium sp. XQZ8]|uniref:hypothetical protein n=1 Tax=Rhizobium populisoli TaxID=2859785 RepID=UPI001CA5E68C|nr:hypothetical protein [Rhizobium populisoli]MBW6420669.1 hypothetical protein [Rhizobium populisoli]